MDALQLTGLIERLGAVLHARTRRRGAEFGLQPVHLQVLDYLSRCNRFSNTAAAVAAYLQVTKGTLSQSLKLLQGRGLVQRRPDAEDRRVVRLSLTDEGREVLVICGADDSLERAVALFQPAAVGTAVSVLAGCLRELQREAGFDGFGECRSCRHLQRPGTDGYRCGLTGESLQVGETLQLCQEHAWPVPLAHEAPDPSGDA